MPLALGLRCWIEALQQPLAMLHIQNTFFLIAKGGPTHRQGCADLSWTKLTTAATSFLPTATWATNSNYQQQPASYQQQPVPYLVAAVTHFLF